METKTMTYEQQAEQFLKNTNVTMIAEFLKFDYHFQNDEHKRNIFKITFERGDRKYSFNFGTSLKDTEEGLKAVGSFSPYIFSHQGYKLNKLNYPAKVLADNSILEYLIPYINKQSHKIAKPTAYDVLACLTKYDVGSFDDFCSEFGYDEDSRTAEKIYKAVLDEWLNVQRLWNDKEIEQLQEIN